MPRLPPFGRYLLHMAKVRYELQVHAGGHRYGSFGTRQTHRSTTCSACWLLRGKPAASRKVTRASSRPPRDC